jgi:hypothetical protein
MVRIAAALIILDFNLFNTIFSNFKFAFIEILTFLTQTIFIEYGGTTIGCVPLTKVHYWISIGIGFSTSIFHIIIQIIPTSWFHITLSDAVILLIFKHFRKWVSM